MNAAAILKGAVEDGRVLLLMPGESPMGREGAWLGWRDYHAVYLFQRPDTGVWHRLAPEDPRGIRRAYGELLATGKRIRVRVPVEFWGGEDPFDALVKCKSTELVRLPAAVLDLDHGDRMLEDAGRIEDVLKRVAEIVRLARGLRGFGHDRGLPTSYVLPRLEELAEGISRRIPRRALR